MKETLKRETDSRITVDINGLAAMLGCGSSTARKIGISAQAKIKIGTRVLYSVKKVEQYIDELAMR